MLASITIMHGSPDLVVSFSPHRIQLESRVVVLNQLTRVGRRDRSNSTNRLESPLASLGSLDVATLDLLLNKLSHDLRDAAALLSGYLGQCLVLLRLQ